MLFKLKIDDMRNLADTLQRAVEHVENFEEALNNLKNILEDTTQGVSFKKLIEDGEELLKGLTLKKECSYVKNLDTFLRR